ncbi:MAG TPA: hypothetical protein VE081_11940 [Sporichthyaceae bacterium]|nr:hypothetical protein [Sporichthyaceae bacterium]
MRVLGPTILALTLAATAGCGSSGGSDNTASSGTAPTAATPSAASTKPSANPAGPSTGSKTDIAAIIKLAKAIDTNKPELVCTTLMTTTMISTTFGTVANCVATDDQDAPTTGATVATVAVNGNKATAIVTDKGGSSDGATGTWHFERTGKIWKLAEWGVDYMRSQVDANFGPKYKSSEAGDPFAVAAYRLCIRDGMLAKDDATFRKLAVEMTTDHNSLAGPVFAACASKGPGGESPFRASFEKGLRDEFHAFGAPAEAADCVLAKLRTALPEATLINALLDGPGSKTMSKVSGSVTTATAACAKGSTGSHPTIRPPKHTYTIRPLH